MAVGAPFKAAGGIIGAVYIYDKIGSAWVQQAVLADKKFSSAINGEFGAAISLDGSQIAVGAPKGQATNSAGLVYVFLRQASTWVEEAILYPPPISKGNPRPFGGSVALQGNTLLIGASRKNGYAGVDWPGVAHVYERGASGWALQATLQPPGDEPDQISFGWSVLLRGDTAFVGSPGDPNTFLQSKAGDVFVFRRVGGQWTSQARISPSDGKLHDFFGGSLALAGNTLAVSARSIDLSTVQFNVGGAYIFELEAGQWNQKAKIIPQGASAASLSGTDVALGANTLVLSAFDYLDGFSGGVCYIFDRRGGKWEEVLKMPPPDGKPGDAFGASVAMSGTALVVGAPGHDHLGPNSGAAYIYELDTGNLVSSYFCKLHDVTPCKPRLVPVGEPSFSGALSGIKYELWALETAPLSTCFLNYSTKGPTAVPYSGGILCLAPPILQTPPVQAGSSPGPCDPFAIYDFNSWIKSGLDPALQPGQQVWFQYLCSDPNTGKLTLTNGSSAVICP